MGAFDRACVSLQFYMLRSSHPHAGEIAAHYARYVCRLAREMRIAA